MGLRSGSKNVARAMHDCGDTLEEKKQQSACLVLIDMSDLTSEVLRHFFGTSEPGLLQASRAYIRELSPAHPHTHTPSTWRPSLLGHVITSRASRWGGS